MDFKEIKSTAEMYAKAEIVRNHPQEFKRIMEKHISVLLTGRG